MHTATIVALATPEGMGGLAVVRLSGPDAVALAGRVFRSARFAAGAASHTAVYGTLHRPGDAAAVIDRCLALTLRAPHSYTGEDTVEFQLHGGRAVARLAVAACREAGAAPAAPGEFTRRAFLNGRLSLDQAEAVADLIAAESEQAARGALNQLCGGLARELAAVEAPLLDLLARLEGSFEFVDDDEAGAEPAGVGAELRAAVAGLERLLALAPAGRLLRDGVQVVLAGPVNAGKSALFNALVGEDRAIVDDEAGTTRDVVSARVVRAGAVCVLHDTAGLREDAGRVEGKGMARTRQAVDEADIVLAVSSTAPFTVAAPRAAVIAVRTKADLGRDGTQGFDVVTSSVTGEGVAALWSSIDAAVQARGLGDAVALGVMLNERHAARLASCRGDLLALAADADGGAPAEVTATMLASILGALGEVSGRVFTEHLLDTVFKRFCVGK
ncbi:MAG TPA: tRNA uridine-5-carboxymethylaminomethyl(34) synthesis GTPase MnmE [Candidatus Krumholzibacteria bacterium]|nr:tRNA uridine-5-carboxymethylaminomethyl(34) synthesis GTPase MnmE [Candidatus Krumholzibacteria bacterium]